MGTEITRGGSEPSLNPVSLKTRNRLNRSLLFEVLGNRSKAGRNAGAGQETAQTGGATYTPNFGFKLANTEYGDVNLSIYSYARYLNQRALEPTYTNAFGVTTAFNSARTFS